MKNPQKSSQQIWSLPHFSRLQLTIIGLGLAVVGIIIVLSLRASTETLYFTPASATVAQNDTLAVSVRVNSGTDPVNAVQANVTYPADKFDVVGISYTGTAFSVQVQEITSTPGLIKMARGTQGGAPASTGDKLFAIITLRAKLSSGSAALAFGTGTAAIRSTDNTDITSSIGVGTYSFTTGTTPPPPPPPPTVPTPPPPPPPAGSISYTVAKTTTAPTIDGNLSEFANITPITFGSPATNNSVTAKAMWDSTNLYLAYQTSDAQLNGSVATRDGAVYNDDAVEWFVDTLNNSGGAGSPSSPYMLSDDFQGIVSLNNVQFDDRGVTASPASPDESWNGAWTSAVTKTGTVNANSDTDTGYNVEVKIPWSTLGLTGPPADDTVMGLGLALDDKDASTSTGVMWPATTTAFQNASKWPRVKLAAASSTADATPPTTPSSLTGTAPTSTQVNLSWYASTDNVGVSGYRVYRGGTQVGTVDCSTGTFCSGSTVNFGENGLTASTAYAYYVVAFDAASNSSAPSTTFNITTPSSSGLCPKAGDVNCDGQVNIFDLSILLSKWGAADTRADFNRNGKVDVFDLSILLSKWGT